MKRHLFCELGPTCYTISLHKEILKRNIKDFFSTDKFASTKSDKELDNLIKSHFSLIVRQLLGVDEQLQISKKANIELSSNSINGIIIKPGEVFSFWKTVGKPTVKKGYKDGLVLTKKGIDKGIGGGLCQMANMIHWLILNSPLEVVELHHHSDSLFPDSNRRVPFGTGTSICYNALDYRFKNNTDQNIQILCWCQDNYLMGELRSEKAFPYRYSIVEEDDCYIKEGKDYYRISKVYQLKIDKNNNVVDKKLVLDNHSFVMYDHSLIPQEKIKQNDY